MESIRTLVPGLLALTTTVVLSACGGGGGTYPSGVPVETAVERYALVASYNNATLASYAVHADSGLMRLVDKRPSITQAISVALRPGHDEVLVLSGNGAVRHFQLNSEGDLSIVVERSVGGGNLTDLVVHPSGQSAYVANAEGGANGIYQFTFDQEHNDELVKMAPDSFVEADYADPTFTDLVISRDGDRLYATDLALDRVARFDVGDDGALTYVDYVDAGDAPYQLAAHPDKDYVYVANRLDGTISQYRVVSGGALEPLAEPLHVAQDVNINVQLEGLVIDHGGRFLYASDLANDTIWQFRIQNDGGLEALATPSIDVPADVTPRALVASPVSDRIYLSDSSGSAMLAFTFAGNGELAPMTPDRLALDAWPSDMVFTTGAALTAHARAAYVINGNDDDISQFTLDDEGTLTPLGDANPATGDFPVAIAAHPTGDYFYVANAGDNTVSQFRRVTSPLLDYETNELSLIQAPVAVDLGPAALAVHPSGNFLYVVSRQNQTISVYNLETNGEIQDNNGVGVYTPDDPNLVDQDQVGVLAPVALTIDPTGRFLWVVNDNAPGFLTLFHIDESDGSLTRIDAASQFAGEQPQAIAVSAGGETLYVASSGTNEVLSYSVAGDGAPTAGPTEAGGQGMVNLLVSPMHNVLYVVNQVDSSVAWLGAANGVIPSTGTAPRGIAMLPGERHLLVTNLASANLTRFSVAQDGALTAEDTVATGVGPQGVAVSGYTD